MWNRYTRTMDVEASRCTDVNQPGNKAIRDGKYLARHMPVLGNVHPIKIENCQSSFWDTPLNCYMLNVAHVTNDV